MSYPNLMVINELLQEYIDTRIENSKSWFGSFDVAFSAVTSKANSIAGIEDIRKELEKDFSEAHDAASNHDKAKAWVELIIKLGNKAFLAQNLTRNHSRLCETLHAIRSYIFNHVTTFPELKLQIDARKDKLRADLISKLAEIDQEKSESNDSVVKKEALCIERDLLLRGLAYLEESKEILSLESDQLNKLFPSLEYPQRPSTGSLISKDRNTKYDLPFVLQENYIQQYVNKYFTKKGRAFSLKEIENTLILSVCKKYGFDPAVVSQFYDYKKSVQATPQLSSASSSSMSPLVLSQSTASSQQATPRQRTGSSGMIFAAINASPKLAASAPTEAVVQEFVAVLPSHLADAAKAELAEKLMDEPNASNVAYLATAASSSVNTVEPVESNEKIPQEDLKEPEQQPEERHVKSKKKFGKK